jgi:hypothetical protein
LPQKYQFHQPHAYADFLHDNGHATALLHTNHDSGNMEKNLKKNKNLIKKFKSGNGESHHLFYYVSQA